MQVAEMTNGESWQSECSEVRTRLSELLMRGLWTDCQLAAGAGRQLVPAHRVLLASASPVFASMLFGSLPAPPDQPLSLPDVEPEIAELLVRYIYTDNIILNSCDVACSLYQAAHYLLMPHLAEVCKSYLVNNVSAEFVLRVYEFAQLFDMVELKEKCLEVMSEETSLVLELVSKTAEIPRAETMAQLFALPKLNVNSEIELVQAVDCWALQHQANSTWQQPKTLENVPQQAAGDAPEQTRDAPKLAEDVRTLLRPALQQIRFLAMNADDFTQYDMSNLLSQSELLAISFNHMSDKSHLPMPAGFTTSREPRELKKYMLTGKIKVNSKILTYKQCDKINIHGRLWSLYVGPNDGIGVEFNYAAEDEEDEEDLKLWQCDVKFTLKVRHPKQPCKVFKENCCYGNVVDGTSICYFTWKELSWEELADPRNGYVVDGAVTVEVYLDVQPPVYF